MKSPIGIEALSLAIPRRYVDLEDLARARGVEPEKFKVGLGCAGWRSRTRARIRSRSRRRRPAA